MKRNMKFLLLLTIFVSSITAAYFISGCGDDSTVIEFPENVTNDTTVIVEETDQVIGTVHGTVSDRYDNSFLAGVTITWINGDSTYNTTTNAGGYWSTPVDLVSGEYHFTFSVTGHAVASGWTRIPELDELRGGVDDRPAGNIYYSDTLDMRLLPLTANVTGKVYTALPAPPVKDGEASMALDDPTLVSVAAGVTVILDYGFDIHPNKYTATTDASGTYTFSNVPLWVGAIGGEAGKADQPGLALAEDYEVDLLTLPFTIGDTTYEGTITENIIMVPGTTEWPNIFAPISGSGKPVVTTEKPVVLTYNFEIGGFLVTDDLVLNFSKPMDALGIGFQKGGNDVDFAASWDGLNMVLTINPALSLIPDEIYTVEVSGYAADGLELYENPWVRPLYTQQGMRFVSTNLDDYGDDDNPFIDFPLGGSITVTFDMDVDLTNANGWVVLYDASNDREVNATISAAGATVTVNPADDLKSYNTYELDFRVFSALRGDYVDDSEVKSPELTFTTLNTATIPLAPTGFALDMGAGWTADWNTTSIDFKWDSVGGAEYYQIFAKDNHLNTDFIVVEDNIDDVSYHTWQLGSVDFTDDANLSFDLFDDDADQTPFSDYTEVTFQVRAVNSAGAGPFSAEITVADETAPAVTVAQAGVADNAARAVDTTFALNIGGFEYVDSAHFVFTEVGGDPAYVFTESDVTWSWNVDMRSFDTVYVTIPAGKTGSVDALAVQVWDNSGNMGTTSIALEPWIVVDSPHVATLDFMAPSYTVRWTSTDTWNEYDWLNIWFSLDGGATWIDSIMATADDGNQAYTVDDTLFSTNALVGIQDTTAGGGWMWQSDVFTWTGLMLTAPDSAAWDDTTLIYDEGGVDSTGVPIAFGSAGLDSVIIVYSLTGAPGSYTNVSDTIEPTGAATTYTWYPDDRGADYNCYLGIRDLDNAQPIHTFGWDFPVIHDFVDCLTPTASEVVPGGADYDITWDTTVANMYDPYLLTGKVRLEYTVDSGATWLSISDSTANDGTHSWAVPATTYSNDSSWIRISDKFGLNVLDTSRTFTISGIVIDSPLTNSQWVGGVAHDILWHTTGTAGTIDLFYSHDNFATDSTQIVLATADDGTHNWSVPNEADSTVWVRAFVDATYTTTGPFLIDGLVLVTPNGGETLANGATSAVTWLEYGAAIDSVYIEYSVEGGAWVMVDSMANTGSYTWLVPDVPSDSVSVRVSQVAGHTGADESDAPFKIAGITVTTPNGGEVWVMGVTETITWLEFGLVGTVQLEYTINNGTDWYVIAGAEAIAVGTETFDWDIDPAIDVNLTGPSPDCLVRVSEVTPIDPLNPLSDASNVKFEIQRSLTVTAPNGGEVWTLGTPEDITWTELGLAGAAVKLEYTLNGTTWYPIVGAQAIASGTNIFNWGLDVLVDTDLAPSVIAEVRVIAVSGPATTDKSNAVFEIQ